MIKHVMFKMLEKTITQGINAKPFTVPDSLSDPFLSAPGVILQLEIIHMLQQIISIYHMTSRLGVK